MTARETVETTVMMLSWNRDSRPTTNPVSTMPVRSVSFQKIRSITERQGEWREEKETEEKRNVKTGRSET